jgi:hypothetical protein
MAHVITIRIVCPRWVRVGVRVAFPVLAIAFGGIALAVPTTFTSGQTLTAADLNGNFADLDSRVTKIEGQVFAKDGNNGAATCDAWCVQTAQGMPAKAGTCVGAFENGGDYRSCSSTNVVANGVFCFCARFGP